jgi:hypothetical protein
VDPLVPPVIRSYLVSENAAREEGQPAFRKPSDEDPDGVDGELLPVFIEPRAGAPAPGAPSCKEDNATCIVSLFYTGGFPTGPFEKFHRKETYDFWVRSASPQLAKRVDERLWQLLHDKRGWNMDGLEVIESMQWRPLQPIGNDPGVYSYTLSYLFELYAETGN